MKMELNLKIIEGVKQFPSLYDNCSDLDDRNHAWIQLAEKLDMNVQYLQIRWHGLLQQYQRNDNFRYANNMQFVYRKKRSKVEEDNWPEFVITEDFLKECNNKDQIEFTYLETEEENKSKTINVSQENDSNYSENNQESDENAKSKEDENKTEHTDLTDKQNHVQDNFKVIATDKPKEEGNFANNTKVKKEVQSEEIEVNESNKTPEETGEKSSEKPQFLVGERCEDVIFGELVSAMLKRMDENKKKSIKKEIMNLLFS